MASVDIFGKPIQGNQHSAFFNNLTNASGKRLSQKERYVQELKATSNRLDDLHYKAKLQALRQRNQELSKLQREELIGKVKSFFK